MPSLAFSATYPLPNPGNDIVGEAYYVKAYSGDTLAKVGLRYGMSYHQMTEANPKINPNIALRAGQRILIPGQFILPPIRKGIVVNMAELRMYYFPPNSNYVMTFPVAMGRDQWRTPTVATTVVMKEKDPVWNVPETIRQYHYEQTGELLPEAVPSGPKNPLGHYALHLGVSGYLIHGNNAPSSIGKFVSSGCIRMNNADIETLFNMVKVGTPVYIVHYPTKVGWNNGVLYQQSQVPVEIDDTPSTLNQPSYEAVVDSAIRVRPAAVDWGIAGKTAKQHLGIPEPIGQANSRSVDADASHALPSPTTTTISYHDNKQDSSLLTATGNDEPSMTNGESNSVDDQSWSPANSFDGGNGE
ncbi:MAG: L,D-transpeptidase family protein [Coxiellaceae bacterium]|nr:MAG: L,D-transpeptidase family protein [Coxiellaceae bacterium]